MKGKRDQIKAYNDMVKPDSRYAKEVLAWNMYAAPTKTAKEFTDASKTPPTVDSYQLKRLAADGKTNAKTTDNKDIVETKPERP